MLAHRKTIMAATATKVAVHVPFIDKALKLMEIPNIPDAEANMVTFTVIVSSELKRWVSSLTQSKADS
jgi:hypothetical protein